MTIELTQEERDACLVVENLLRALNACEVRPWRESWFRGDDGAEVDTSIYLRTHDEPLEIAGMGLAQAIELASAFRAIPVGGSSVEQVIADATVASFDGNGSPA